MSAPRQRFCDRCELEIPPPVGWRRRWCDVCRRAMDAARFRARYKRDETFRREKLAAVRAHHAADPSRAEKQRAYYAANKARVLAHRQLKRKHGKAWTPPARRTRSAAARIPPDQVEQLTPFRQAVRLMLASIEACQMGGAA